VSVLLSELLAYIDVRVMRNHASSTAHQRSALISKLVNGGLRENDQGRRYDDVIGFLLYYISPHKSHQESPLEADHQNVIICSGGT